MKIFKRGLCLQVILKKYQKGYGTYHKNRCGKRVSAASNCRVAEWEVIGVFKRMGTWD